MLNNTTIKEIQDNNPVPFKKNLNKRITKRFIIAKATNPFLFLTSNFLTKLER